MACHCKLSQLHQLCPNTKRHRSAQNPTVMNLTCLLPTGCQALWAQQTACPVVLLCLLPFSPLFSVFEEHHEGNWTCQPLAQDFTENNVVSWHRWHISSHSFPLVTPLTLNGCVSLHCLLILNKDLSWLGPAVCTGSWKWSYTFWPKKWEFWPKKKQTHKIQGLIKIVSVLLMFILCLPEQRQLYLRTTWLILRTGSSTVWILPTLPWVPWAPCTPCVRVLQMDTLLEAPLPPVAIVLPRCLQGGPHLPAWGMRPPAQRGMGPILKETEVVMQHLPFSNVCCYAGAVLES